VGFGRNALIGTKYERFKGVCGAAVDFELAKNADILVGTTISSFSVDLATDRFFRNDYVNYFFNETGVYHWTKAEEKFPLRKNSLLIFIAVLPSWKMC